MTIQEAIKSGKKFKRKYMDYWITEDPKQIAFSCSDILADDWEIEREPEEVWLVKHDSGYFYEHFFSIEREARNSTVAQNSRAGVIKFREVIE